MSGFEAIEAIEVIGDGKTVWVNNESGDCLARFGTLGIDNHTSTEEQLNGASQCLYCTHGKTDINDWLTLKLKVNEIYGVHVPEQLSPFQ